MPLLNLDYVAIHVFPVMNFRVKISMIKHFCILTYDSLPEAPNTLALEGGGLATLFVEQKMWQWKNRPVEFFFKKKVVTKMVHPKQVCRGPPTSL